MSPGFAGLIFVLTIAGLRGLLFGAALVSLASPPTIPFGLEANRGQAKPEILFLNRSVGPNVAIMAQGVLYSPFDIGLRFVGSNVAPQVRPSAPLPGVANAYTGANWQNWAIGVPRYGSVEFGDVYAGIDVQYVASESGLSMRLVCRPGCNLNQAVFQLSGVPYIERTPAGALFLRLDRTPHGPYASYAPPVAYQETRSGRLTTPVSYEILAEDQFRFGISGYDASLPLYVELNLAAFEGDSALPGAAERDQLGNTYLLAELPDAAGKEAPFPDRAWAGCGNAIGWPAPCRDLAVYKFSSTGELAYVTYLSGRTNEVASTLKLAKSGVLVAGATDSSDFPVTTDAYQHSYAGPEATVSVPTWKPAGDLFALKLDAATGVLAASTYVGGPDADAMENSSVHEDGSICLLAAFSSQLPVTPGAIRRNCEENSCTAYAIRLDASLNRPIYATYLPGKTRVTKLHSDGSLYFAGSAGPGFPVSSNAYQKAPAGIEDGFIARLSASGANLLFGTYYGTPNTDSIRVIAVAPDGSVWATVNSYRDETESALIHLDAAGSRLLYARPFGADDLLVDTAGNVLSLSWEKVNVSPDALLAHACGPLFMKMTPGGDQVFATYLPYGSPVLRGFSESGNPILSTYRETAELSLAQSTPTFAGCAGDGNTISPGEIVTIFGSGIGPRDGVSFRLEDGRVPTAAGGTRVLLDGEAIPILYASYWQVNAIVPYSLPLDRIAKLQVESNDGKSNEIALDPRPPHITLFTRDGSGSGQAAALNEDGTLNSPGNPAKPGSVMTLFGAGGGPTTPPSVAGEVTPLELRRLDALVEVSIWTNVVTTVEFAGAAPGLVAGVTQINIRLPQVIPDIPYHPRTALPLYIFSPRDSTRGSATIAVE